MSLTSKKEFVRWVRKEAEDEFYHRLREKGNLVGWNEEDTKVFFDKRDDVKREMEEKEKEVKEAIAKGEYEKFDGDMINLFMTFELLMVNEFAESVEIHSKEFGGPKDDE